MKIFIILIVFCVSFTIAACNNSNVSSTSPQAQPIVNSHNGHMESDYPYKDIKITEFISAVVSEDTLIPGEGSVWNMDKETFIKEIYGSELLDPKSDLFEEHRNTTMPDGNTSVEPPLHIVFEDIDKVSTAYPIYLFDSENKLYCINYRYVFKTSQIDQYKKIVDKILEVLNKEKDTLVLQKDNKIPDMNAFDFTKDKLSLKWFTVNQNQFIRMTSIEFQGQLILDLTISNKSALTQSDK